MNKHLNLAMRHKASEEGRLAAYQAVLNPDYVINPYGFPICEARTAQANAWRESFDETYSKHRRDRQ